MTLLIVFNAVAAFLASGRHAFRHDWPGTRWLDDIPWPARRKDSTCTTAATAASTASTTRPTKSRAPKAATTEWQVEPARGRHAMRLERGRDGLLHTGPMQAIPDGYGSLPDTPIDYWLSLYGPARQQQQHGADLAGAVKLAGHAGRGL